MRAPEGKELDAVLLVGEDLAFKLGHMLLPPVIGDFFDAHLRDHLGTGFGATLRGVKRHDAPRSEVGFVEEIGGGELAHGTHGKDQEAEVSKMLFGCHKFSYPSVSFGVLGVWLPIRGGRWLGLHFGRGLVLLGLWSA